MIPIKAISNAAAGADRRTRIRAMLALKQWSQRDLAERTAYSYETARAVLSGRDLPKVLDAIEKALTQA